MPNYDPYTKKEREQILKKVPLEGPETKAQRFAVRYEATVKETEDALDIQNEVNDQIVQENEQLHYKVEKLKQMVDSYLDVLKSQDVRLVELLDQVKKYEK